MTKIKKVGILTFQRAVNYGATLQMYALQRKIHELNGNAEIIDYDNEKISSGYKTFQIFDLLHPHGLVGKLINHTQISKRNKKFAYFDQKYMKFTTRLRKQDLSSINDLYDCYIVGSDQVWNPTITGDDESYFLSFVKDDKKKFSYAASFGASTWPKTSTIPLKKLLPQFNHISIREITGAKIVHGILPNNNNISVNIDPVFLLGQSDWKGFVKQPKSTQRPYLFVYTVGSPQRVYEFARKMATERNLEIINLRYAKSLRNRKNEIGRVIYDASPDEFVSFIANADCVVTNSFHATAFSIIFNKDMYVEMPRGLSSRIQDLFQLLGITNRTLGKSADKLNWTQINKKLAQAREESLQYIKEILAE